MDTVPEREKRSYEKLNLTTHHISMTVKDLDKVLKFYESLGFEKIFHWKNNELKIVHLTLNGFILEIFSFKNSKDKREFSLDESLRETGLNHFALKTDDIFKTAESLKKLGLISEEVDIVKGRTGILYFFIQDPEGNFIEIVQDNRKFIIERENCQKEI
ncbi:VOC family protein [Persephonella sp.]